MVALVDPVAVLAGELRTMLRKRAVDLVDPAELPILHDIVTRQEGGEAVPQLRVMNLQPMLDSSIAGIADQETRSALEVLLGDSDLRFRSMKERGTKAANLVGVSYDAYRRARSGRIHSDLLLLASQVATSHPTSMLVAGVESESEAILAPMDGPNSGQAVPAASTTEESMQRANEAVDSSDGDDPTTAPLSGRRNWLVLASLFGVVLVVGSILALTRRPASQPSAGSSSPVSPLPVATIAPDAPGASTEPVDDVEAASSGAATAAWIEPVCRPAGYVDTDAPSDLDPDMTEAAVLMAELGSMLPEGSCMDHPVAHRGSAYWQQFSTDRRLGGGIIVFRPGSVREASRSDEMMAVYLPLGLWQSYFRIAGGDGSRSPDMAGFPTGEVLALGGDAAGQHFQMEVLGEVTLIGEETEGTFYWMPLVAREVWLEAEASDSPIGWPTSSVYISDGLLRVDFTDGYLEQDDQSVIQAFAVDDIASGLGEIAALKGRIVRSLDGTGWFVDQELKRWWIPDGQTWNCVGGDGNVILGDLRGYEVHALEYGGVAGCPMSAESLAPVGGGLDLALYCYDWAGAGSETELADDGWVCQGETGAEPIDQTEACWWQYGSAAVVVVDTEDSRHWQCEQAMA